MLGWPKNKFAGPTFAEGYYVAENLQGRGGLQIVYYNPCAIFETTMDTAYTREAVLSGFTSQNYDRKGWSFKLVPRLDPKDFIEGYERFSKKDGWYPAFRAGSRKGIHFVYYQTLPETKWKSKHAECRSMFDVYCQHFDPKEWTFLRGWPIDLDALLED